MQPRLQHDRLTWLTFGQLGVYGYFLYGFGASVPLLRDDERLSRTVSGLHGTALAVGALVVGVLFAPLVARIGRPAAIRLGLLGLGVGAAVYCAGGAVPVTLLGALLAGTFGSVVVNASSSILSAHHGPAGPSAISEANAAAAAAGLIAPLALAGSVTLGFGWRPGLLVSVVAAAGMLLVSGRNRRDRAEGADDPADAAAPGRLPGRYWLTWLVLMFCVGVEFCVTIWSSDLLRTNTGAAPATATAGVTAVVAGMLVGRVAGGWLALRMDTGRLLLVALGISLVGFAVSWLAGTVPLAFAGLSVLGLGIALHFPLGVARSIQLSGGRPDLAVGRVSWATGLASGLGPFALGALADRFGTHTAFLLVPVLIAAAAGAVLLTMARPAPISAAAGRPASD